MNDLHPIRLEASFHETIWGGRRLERDGWKKLPCLIACRYFVTRTFSFQHNGSFYGETGNSCILLSSLGAEVQVRYGTGLQSDVWLAQGQTMVLPAALGSYSINGTGNLLFSYVPAPGDEAWKVWETRNS